MNISGINSYLGFYDYNSIKTSEAEKLTAIPVEASAKKIEQMPQETKAEEIRNQSFTAADYAKEYRPDAEYELRGVDSDISKLDVTQAISDMHKDKVLQQYQFFVGESRAQGGVRTVSAANMQAVRGMEDFSL